MESVLSSIRRRVAPAGLGGAVLALLLGMGLAEGKSLEEYAQEAVQRLAKEVPERTEKPWAVALGTFAYQQTHLSSPFLEHFRTLLGKNLPATERFAVVEREQEVLQKLAQEWRLALEGLVGENLKRVGRLYGADYFLFGRGWETEHRVLVELRLTAVETGKQVVDVVKVVKDETEGLPLKPAVADSVDEALALLNVPLYLPSEGTPPNRPPTAVCTGGTPFSAQAVGDLRLTVLTDRDFNPVYHLGENLTLLLSANRPCFVWVYYTDVEGNTTQIFPNRFRKDNWIDFTPGRVERLPSPEDRFDFRVVEPLGTELVVVYASTQPFEPQVKTRSLGPSGLLGVEGTARSVIRAFRQRAVEVVEREGAFAEASCTVITMR